MVLWSFMGTTGKCKLFGFIIQHIVTLPKCGHGTQLNIILSSVVKPHPALHKILCVVEKKAKYRSSPACLQ